MPEEGKKYFLDDFFRIMSRNAKRDCVAEKRIAKLLKELHHLAFDLRRCRRKRRLSDGWKRQPGDRIARRHMLGSLKCIFYSSRFCSRFFERFFLELPRELPA